MWAKGPILAINIAPDAGPRMELTFSNDGTRLAVARREAGQMRGALALLPVLGSLLLAGSFAGTATADAPNLDLHASGKNSVANYQLTPTTHLTVGAADFVTLTGEHKHSAFVGMDEEPACVPDCLLPPIPLLEASAEFDSPQLHGGVNGAKLDVTLPVTYCALSSCPTGIHVSLVWQPDAQPIRNTNSTRTDTATCHFTEVTRLAYTHATATGFVSDGTSNLASGGATGSMLEQSIRVVGFGDPAVCL